MSIGQHDAIRLVGDVGGTNARFALVRSANGALENQHTLPTAGFTNLADAINAYLAAQGGARPIEAAVAMANPVTGDRIQLTNNNWAFSIEATRAALGLERLLILNDFEALALALPGLAEHQLRQIGPGAAAAGAAKALIGPGTGLGVAGLIHAGGNWQALPGEGGHVTLCATNEREAQVIATLWREFSHVSAERVISGMGLENLYRAVALLNGAVPQPIRAAEVTSHGLSGADAHCAEALAMFCAMLGTIAGNLALTLGARGGVYIGGGIVPRLGGYFAGSAFRERFEAKGRFKNYLAGIPTYVIDAESPALIGSARALGIEPDLR